MKTNELTGAALDWAVAKCEGINYAIVDGGLDYDCPDYSRNWAQGGPIIEREGIAFVSPHDDILMWEAVHPNMQHDEQYGPTPLVAAMRCYVASKLGDEVEIPEELRG